MSRRATRRRQRKLPPPPTLVNVSYRTPLAPDVVAHLLFETTKHLLFMRQQIPLPFDELARWFQREQVFAEGRDFCQVEGGPALEYASQLRLERAPTPIQCAPVDDLGFEVLPKPEELCGHLQPPSLCRGPKADLDSRGI